MIVYTLLHRLNVSVLILSRESSVACTRALVGASLRPMWGSHPRFNSLNAPSRPHRSYSAFLTFPSGPQLLEHHAMAFSAPRDSSGGRQLPTRVSNACDRCRRNKSRCDPFRPCSLCTRANVECLTGNNEDHARPAKRKRTQEPLRHEHTNSEPPTVNEPPSQPAPAPGHNSSSEPGLLPASELHQDAESRRPSVGDGPVDSAVGIAHKVSL
jgi:hypothetical protein